jgi:gas vesicle protein
MDNTAQEKLKQLNEASSLLDELSWRICWAQDFSKFGSINEILDPVGDAISEALDEVNEAIEDLEEAIKEEEADKALAVAEVESEGRVQYLLD